MFLDQYLNESNDMMISSMSPILSESDIEELKNTEDDNVQELYECFTDNEVETMLLIESAELLYESKAVDIAKKVYNKLMLMIDKLINKIKTFINQMRSKGYTNKINKMYNYIKENIDKLPKDYEYKSNGEFYLMEAKDEIIFIENRLADIINNPEGKTEEDIKKAYESSGYKDEKDFYETFKSDAKMESKVVYANACRFINDNIALMNVDFYKTKLKKTSEVRTKIQSLVRNEYYNNNIAKMAAAQCIKLLNLEEYCIRANIAHFMSLYKDMYNTIKANK